MEKLFSLIRLEPLKGSRTQFTIISGLALNALVQLGIIHLTPEQLKTVNDFLILIGSYFFAEKVSK